MRLQSAMEYLMTYGWAILIIAVALAVLFYFGVFNPSSFVGQQCVLQSGLSCTIVSMSANGMLTINLAQASASQTSISITAVGCNSNAAQTPTPLPSQVVLGPESNVTLAVQCYSGASTFYAPVGSTFQGYLSINYNETYTGFPHVVSGKVLAKTSSTSSTNSACYPLTVSYGTGGASATASPSNSAGCPSGLYTSGTPVTLTATASSGYGFGGWTGYYSSISNPWTTFTMPASAATETAGFSTTCYPLTLSYGTGGASATASPPNSMGCSSGSYLSGAPATLTATGTAGNVFSGWTGTYASTSNPWTTFTMPLGAANEIASFSSFTCYPLTLSASPTAGGTATASPSNSVGCSSGNYASGQSITLSETPNTNYVFSGWSGQSTTSQFTMPSSAATETANFNTCYLLTLTSSPSAGGTATASPSSSTGCSAGYYTSGQSITLAETANSGYVFTSWSGQSTSSSFSMPANAAIEYVNFGILGLWTAANPLTAAAAGGSCVLNNNYIYCALGAGTSTVDSAAITNNVIGTWSAGTSLTAAMTYGSCVINPTANTAVSYIYCAIGSGTTTVDQAVITNNVIGAWSASANSLVTPLYLGSCILNTNHLYCAAGYVSGAASNTVETATITNNVIGTWTAASSLAGPMEYGTCVVSNNNIYCPLGVTGSETTIDQAVITNNVIGAWSASANSLPGAFMAGSCVVSNNNIYCTGGGGGSAVYTATITNNVIGTWSTGNPLTATSLGASCVVYNYNIYCAIGGYPSASTTVDTAPI